MGEAQELFIRWVYKTGAGHIAEVQGAGSFFRARDSSKWQLIAGPWWDTLTSIWRAGSERLKVPWPIDISLYNPPPPTARDMRSITFTRDLWTTGIDALRAFTMEDAIILDGKLVEL